jgi:excisionase family DNA binding protein
MYLTVKEAAERLAVSSQTVWQLLKSGQLTGIKLRRQWRVPVSGLAEYTARQTVPAAAR